MKIGVIGHSGVVGGAVYKSLAKCNRIGVSLENINDYPQTEDCDLVFICVSTPMSKDGSVNLSYLHESIDNLAKNMRKGILVIKSTVLPGTNGKLSKKYPQFNFISSPEFLTAAYPFETYVNQDRLIIGAESSEAADILESVYRNTINCNVYYRTKPIEAELIKYLSNSFLAMKVIYANQCKQLADKLGADWDKVAIGVGLDHRIGHTHLKVNSKGGYDGMCFPKDVSGIVELAKSLNVDLSLLNETNDWNKKVRSELYI